MKHLRLTLLLLASLILSLSLGAQNVSPIKPAPPHGLSSATLNQLSQKSLSKPISKVQSGMLSKAPRKAAEEGEEFEYNGLWYTVLDREARICETRQGSVEWITDSTFYSTPGNYFEGDLIIPSTVSDGEEEYTVVRIGDWGFSVLENITSLTIGESVSEIGIYAFHTSTSLSSLNGGAGLTSIGERAFEHSGLTALDLTLSSQLKTISGYVFSDCRSLQSVNLPVGLESIEEDAFWQCSSLSSIIIPSSVTSLGKSTFQETGLVSVDLSRCERLTSIAAYAFCQNPTLSDVQLPANLTSIGEGAFAQCPTLSRIEIPANLTSLGAGAFWKCNGLSTISIPSTISSVGPGAFQEAGLLSVDLSSCDGLTSISEFVFFKNPYLAEVRLPANLTSIGEGAFTLCPNLSSVAFPSTITHLGKGAFQETGLISVDLSSCDALTSISEYAFCKTPALAEVKLPAKITSLEQGAFYQCYSLKELELPTSLEKIGFGSCYESGLTSIALPASLYSIDEIAFAECPDLTSISYAATKPITAPSNCFDSATYASALLSMPKADLSVIQATTPWKLFDHISTPNTGWYISGGFQNWVNKSPEYEFATYDKTGVYRIELPQIYGDFLVESSKGDWLLSNGRNIEVGVPYSYKTGLAISTNHIFLNGTVNNAVITLDLNAKTILLEGDYVADSATEVYLVGDFGSGWNESNTSRPLTLKAGTTNTWIGTYTLTAVTSYFKIRSGINIYGTGGEDVEVVMGRSYTAYKASGLAFYLEPGKYDFEFTCEKGANTGTLKVTLTPVHHVGDSFKYGDFYYRILDLDAKTCELIPPGIGKQYPMAEANIPPVALYDNIGYTVIHIADQSFNNNTAILSVTFPETLVSIGGYAFNNTQISSIDVLPSVTTLGNHAFSNCKNLTEVSIPNTVTSMGEGMFMGCVGLTSVTLPDNMETLGVEFFRDCTSLVSITLPESIKTIGGNAFTNCYNLANVTLPSSLVEMGGNMFWRCTSLSSIDIPSTVTIINDDVFHYCSALESIELPESVSIIGRNAFGDCTALTKVVLPASITELQGRVFQNSNAITEVVYYAQTPVEANWNCFDTQVYDNAVLNMPNATLEAIAATTPWNLFKRVNAKDGSLPPAAPEPVTFNYAIPADGSTVETLNGIQTYWNTGDRELTVNYDLSVSVLDANGDVLTTGVLDIDFNDFSNYIIILRDTDLPPGDYTILIPEGILMDEDGQPVSEAVTLNYTLHPTVVIPMPITLAYADPANGSTVETIDGIKTYWNGGTGEMNYDANIPLQILDAEGNAVCTATLTPDNDEPAETKVFAIAVEEAVLPMGDYTVRIPEGALVDPNTFVFSEPVILHYTIQYDQRAATITLEPAPGDYDELPAEFVITVEGPEAIKRNIVGGNPILITNPEGAKRQCPGTYEGNKITVKVPQSDNRSIRGEYIVSIRDHSINFIWPDGSTTTCEPQDFIYRVDMVFEPVTFNYAEPADGSQVESLEEIRTFWNVDGRVLYGSKDESKFARLLNEAGETIATSPLDYDTADITRFDISFPGEYGTGEYIVSIPEGALVYEEQYGLSEAVELHYFIDRGTPAPEVGSEFEYQGLWYVVTDNEAMTCQTRGGNAEKGGNAVAGDLEIPQRAFSGEFEFAVTAIGEYGFAGCDDLLSVSVPETVDAVGEGAFDDCQRLTSLIWRPDRAIDPSVAESLANPNMLLYVADAKHAPKSKTDNVVVMGQGEGVCARLVLMPGRAFRAVLPFTASHSEMTKKFTQTTAIDGGAGWETIVLPFDVRTVRTADGRDLTPFAAVTNIVFQYPYWLSEADASGDWKEATALKAGVPYIIAMPNNGEYIDRYNISGEVTFANDRAMRITPETTAPYAVTWASGREFRSLWLPLPSDELAGALGLNVGIDDLTDEAGQLLLPGSAFHAGVAPLPLEAYVTRAGAARAVRILSPQSALPMVKGDATLRVEARDGVLTIHSGRDCRVDVFRADGVRVATCEVKAGEPYTLRALGKGVYIVAGRKFVM